ncbi:MAG TPA: hypothetical protein DFS52_10210, partial [Myxococcales bacterium]|nr:hypothetical protein [Myxococcales bacterium]
MAESGREELAAVAADLRGHLEWLRDSGATALPVPPPVEPVASSRPAAGAAGGAISSLRAAVRASVGADGGRASPSVAAALGPAAPTPHQAAPSVAVARQAAVPREPP